MPAEIEQIVFKAIEKDPANRYQSMRELTAALSQFKQSMSTSDTVAPVSITGNSDTREESSSTLVTVRDNDNREESNITLASVGDNEQNEPAMSKPPYMVNRSDSVTSEITAAHPPAFEPNNSVWQQQRMSSLVSSPKILAMLAAVFLSIGAAIVLSIMGTSYRKAPVPQPENRSLKAHLSSWNQHSSTNRFITRSQPLSQLMRPKSMKRLRKHGPELLVHQLPRSESVEQKNLILIRSVE